MVRVGFLGVAHGHAYGYAAGVRRHPDAEAVGVWDVDPERRARFASRTAMPEASSTEDLFAQCDAVVICSPNRKHAEDGELAANAGKAILCEKPLVTSEEEAARLMAAVERNGVLLMTAFPCRFSPAYRRLKARVAAGDIGQIRAVCATNRGSCPFDWFVDVEQSGGGAMIDHTVHVTDLLRDLLGCEVGSVQAHTGNNTYAQTWEDTAMLTLDFENGVFATLDSSWSRPSAFKTWGDVTMSVVGDRGVLELDMFGQEIDVFATGDRTHRVGGYGSDLDALLLDGFISAVRDGTPPPVTGYDGLQAARVALAGYASVQSGQPVTPPA